MPNYLLSVCYPADAVAPEPGALQQIMERVATLTSDMQEAGVWVFGGGLHDASSSTGVARRDSEMIITDGPFIESKEQIGGITIIEVGDLDEALAWAGRHTTAIGVPIEVRPFHGMPAQ